MKFKYIILLLTIFIDLGFNNSIFALGPEDLPYTPAQPPNCTQNLPVESPDGKNLTIIGHSRALMLGVAYYRDNEVKNATINGIPILLPGSTNLVQNLGWGGARITPSDENILLLRSSILYALVYFNPYNPISPNNILSFLNPVLKFINDIVKMLLSPVLQILLNFLMEPLDSYLITRGYSNWNHQALVCASKGLYYHTTHKTVMNIGGNDLISFYNWFEKEQALYFWILAFSNPLQFLTEYVTGGFTGGNELFWLWQSNVKTDQVTEGTISLMNYILGQDKNNEILLISDGPVLGSGDYPDLIDLAPNYKLYSEMIQPNYWQKWIRLSLLFNDMRGKFSTRLIPYFINLGYRDRVHYLDIFDRFFLNIIFEGASNYFSVPGNITTGDGIHYSAQGNRSLAQMLAFKMAQIGWFILNPEILYPPKDPAMDLTITGNCIPTCSSSWFLPYSFQFNANGAPPITWSISGNVPPGASMNSVGLLSGPPTWNFLGTWSFTVKATDSLGNTGSAVAQLSTYDLLAACYFFQICHL